jgi:hypothetical protein
MESIRLDFVSGTWYFIVLAAIACIGLALFAYKRTTPPIGPRYRGVLVALRSIGLLALMVMLFEPLFRIVRSDSYEQRVAIAIDGSLSMKLRDRSRDRLSDARAAASLLQERLGERADVFVFDESLRTLAGRVDSMRPKGFRTDIGAAIRGIANTSEEMGYGAIVLVSDGNHNSGEQPLYSAERSGLGVYAIGIGDTIAPVDVRMSSISTTSVGVVGESQALIVDIEQSNISDRSATLVIADNGKDIARIPISFVSTVPRYQHTYQWIPPSEGVHVVSARIDGAGSEFTLKNNSIQTTVQVRKNKKRVLIISGAPSPDLSFLRLAISADPTVELLTYVQRDATTFYEGALTPAVLSDVAAFVLVGFPTAISPKGVLEEVATRCRRGASLFFVASLSVDYGRLGSLADLLPFRVVSNRPIEMNVTPDVSSFSAVDPLMRITGGENDADAWNTLPPVYRSELFAEPTQGSTVLSQIKIGTTAINEPLIIKRDVGATRSLAVLGYGIYRWKLLGQGAASSRGAAQTDVLQYFMSNAIKWLSVKDDERRVQIRSTYDAYVVGESIGFTASVLDQTFSAVDDAVVTVSLEGAGSARTVQLSPRGSARYATTIGTLPPGRYTYVGSAVVRGSVVGRDQGSFTVGDVGLEDQTTTMNAALLRLLAQRTGGAFSVPDSIDALVEQLLDDPRLQPVVRTTEREYPLHHLPWIVAVAILSFGSEWLLRKRRGLV